MAELASKQPPTSLRPRPTPATTLSSRLPLVPAASVVPSADNEVASTGPIYEDIDRMCSYRGYPPDLQQKSPQQLPSAASGSGGLNEDYYNLSGGSSPRNKSSNRYVIKKMPLLQKIMQNEIYVFSVTSVLKAQYRGCVQCHQPLIIDRRNRYIRQGWPIDLQQVPYTITVIHYVKVEWVLIPGLAWIRRPLKHIINLVEVAMADLPPLRKPRSFSKIHRDSRLERKGEMIPKCDVDDDLVR